MNATGLHAEQVTCIGIEILLDLQLRIVLTASVINSPITDIALDTLDSSNHGPSAVVVRRRATAGQPVHDKHG
jgi:hypothetical protein